MKIACVLITHLRAKVEMRRRPDLKDRPAVIVGRCRGRPAVVDCFPAATGVAVGMTPEQALSRQPGGILLEADEAAYSREFRRMLASLLGSQRPGGGSGAWRGLRGPGRAGGDVRRRGPADNRPAERPPPGPDASGGHGRRQVFRLRGRPRRQAPGRGQSSCGHGRFPGAPPG